MFTEVEYSYYRKHVQRALTDDNIVRHDAPVASTELMDSVSFWDNGDDSSFNEFTNVTIYHSPEIDKAFYCIDIFDNLIEFDYCGYGVDSSRKSKVFSTELFSTGSDEEFFQVGTVLDLSFIDEDLLRQFIQLSLMARKNKNIKESK